MFNKNSGYLGNQMSVRAKNAYETGQMPLSKWSKGVIIDEIMEHIAQYNLTVDYSKKDLEKLTKDELEMFLSLSSWHHTGKFYNKTIFYEIDLSVVENFNLEILNSIISTRTPKSKIIKKEKPVNMYVTANVRYSNWEGTRAHPKKVYYQEIVKYRSDDKMINTFRGKKRISNVEIIEKIEQKTKYAESSRLKTNKQ